MVEVCLFRRASKRYQVNTSIDLSIYIQSTCTYIFKIAYPLTYKEESLEYVLFYEWSTCIIGISSHDSTVVIMHLLGVDVVGEFLVMEGSSKVTEERVDSSEEVIGQSSL